MTATGLKHEALPPPAARRIGSEVVALLGLPARAPRRTAGAPTLPLARVALALVAAVLAIGAAMLVLDGWALGAQKRVPIWVIDLFNEITDYGRSGWFLWPAGILAVALAVLAATTQRLARLTIVSLIVRLEFIFVAIGLPGLIVSIIKRLIGRVRPSEATVCMCRSPRRSPSSMSTGTSASPRNASSPRSSRSSGGIHGSPSSS